MIACLIVAFSLQPADLVIEKARIWTDGRTYFASTLAVRDGAFVHVGDADPSLIGPETKRVDVGGALVVPGLFDSHIHMLNGGMQLSRLNLRDATDKEDFIAKVRDWAAKLGPREWILGGRWSTESWSIPELPHRAWIDAASGGRPAWLSRMDGHSGLANSEALRRAGITREGPADPPGGVIDRDPQTGEPTGILRETAMGLVARLVPAESTDDRLAALKRAIDYASEHGITSVSDVTSMADLPIYERLAQEGPSKVRLHLYPTSDDWAAAAQAANRFRGLPGFIEIKGFKAYMDGSLGSRTAYMRAPFLGNPPDRPDWRGLPMPGVLEGLMERNVRAADQAGYQAIVHAIGDEGNHLLLNIVQSATRDPRQARARSEHAQHLLPEDIERFARLGVIASMQPYHKADDGRYAEDYIGKERCHSSYAFKSLLDVGAVVAFGSDWPVVTLNPFLGLEAAVTGRIISGVIWEPQENISLAEALRCYTSAAAYAVKRESDLGRIAPGYQADFIVLNQDLFVPPVTWDKVKPTAVYVAGRRVLGM